MNKQYLTEGPFKKCGVNQRPTSHRPPPPAQKIIKENNMPIDKSYHCEKCGHIIIVEGHTVTITNGKTCNCSIPTTDQRIKTLEQKMESLIRENHDHMIDVDGDSRRIIELEQKIVIAVEAMKHAAEECENQRDRSAMDILYNALEKLR